MKIYLSDGELCGECRFNLVNGDWDDFCCLYASLIENNNRCPQCQAQEPITLVWGTEEAEPAIKSTNIFATYPRVDRTLKEEMIKPVQYGLKEMLGDVFGTP